MVATDGVGKEVFPVQMPNDARGTPIEIDYYQFGGILPYVLRQLAANA